MQVFPQCFMMSLTDDLHTQMGWGYWKYATIPPVDLLKYLEPRYLTQVCDRWSRDKTNIIQLAWFNGDGVETWQNIWGIWQGLTPRDAAALKRLGPLLRFFGRARTFLQSVDWVPHTPMLQSDTAGVYASAWPLGQETLWTVVNRGTTDASGGQIRVSDTRSYYDCYHGGQLQVTAQGTVAFEVEAGAFGCVLATPNKTLSADAQALLGKMHALTAGKKLNSFSKTWSALQQTMVPNPPTPPHGGARPPGGMVTVPAVANFSFVATGVEIEGQRWGHDPTPMAPRNGDGDAGAEGVDVQFPWEKVATPHHKHTMAISKFFMHKTPVTRQQYAEYLAASKYTPAEEHNFLRNWTKVGSSWQFHPADADKPVVHVSLTEARLYCAHYGWRLPHTYEWSLAAQGTDGRSYPWGAVSGCQPKDEKCLDKSAVDGTHCPLLQQHTQGDQEGLQNVSRYPHAASPYGVLDMVGNVWQFTSEFQDAHTRAVLVRGGSHYYPVGNAKFSWYFPNSAEMRKLPGGPHGKYMLMSDSYDRAGTVGFRCVAD